MSVYFQATIELHAAGVTRFIQTMETVVPILEGAGWRLRGAYMQRTGRLHTAIDIWEIDDYNHFDAALKVLTGHARFAEIGPALAETISRETVVFMERLSYMR